MSEFQYDYAGDTPKTFRGRYIVPGDVIEADEELLNGEFKPKSKAAKAAAKLREPAEAAAPVTESETPATADVVDAAQAVAEG